MSSKPSTKRRPSAAPPPNTFATWLTPQIHSLLVDLQIHPHPTLASTEQLPRRASVALILRFRPHHGHPATRLSAAARSPRSSSAQQLDAFFAQEWVRHADPEILFIKRSINPRDKWTGHVALSGGKRDDEVDQDDMATAVRETREETGLDLDTYAMPAGNLAQLVVSTAWGKQLLMTLCPYVFVLVDAHVPPLRPQPGEVASVHWVPVRSLLDPKWRTYQRMNVAGRVSGSNSQWIQTLFQFLTGDLLHSAIRLRPSESVSATESLEYALPLQTPVSIESTNITIPLLFPQRRLANAESPDTALFLWGLTLSVIGNFCDQLAPYDITSQFIYPSFTAPDMRFLVWLTTNAYRQRKASEAHRRLLEANISPDAASETESIQAFIQQQRAAGKRHYGRLRSDVVGKRRFAAYEILPGYYSILHQTVLAMSLLKVGVVAALIVVAYRRLA